MTPSQSNCQLKTASCQLHKNASIFVAGHKGMVGSAIVRRLKAEGYERIITRTRAELDLTEQAAVRDFFRTEKIDCVVLAAARVGGIHANNTYRAEFIYLNLMVQNNVIHEAYKAGVENLLFLGSSCIYPKFTPQPMKEEHLLTGILEPTNEPYAIAKIAGIKMCESYNRQYGTKYRAVMPTNLYGPYDNFHLENSHVLPALIRKFHLAKLALGKNFRGIQRDEALFGPIPPDIKESLGLQSQSSRFSPRVVIWGTGQARREFLHVDDMAAASLFVLNLDQSVFTFPSPTFLNVGAGQDATIAEIAALIKEIVGFEGEMVFDSDKPDGTPQKLLDSSRINGLGWQPSFSLRAGLADAYQWYCEQVK